MPRIGQISAELVSIMGIAMAVIFIFMTISLSFISNTSAEKNEKFARESVQRLASAAESVYAQGEGAATLVEVHIPPNTVFDPAKTYIGKPPNAPPHALPKSININLGGSDISAETSHNLVGSFPAKSGTYLMRVYSAGSYVVISPYIVKIDKPSLSITMGVGEARSETILLSKLVSSPVYAKVAPILQLPNITMSISPAELEISPSGSAFILFVFPQNGTRGVYNMQLEIHATSEIGNQTFIIPFTLNVV
ncbi:MAG: hypothetical protein N3G80_02220 [Candidatus Micrarchaeota archaeon]|nr:hypothetical protein [Candidatus Micrarchaeota archaeon]